MSRFLPKTLAPLLAGALLVFFPVVADAASQLCSSGGRNQSYEWVTKVSIAGKSIDVEKTGYLDATSTIVADIVAGETFAISAEIATNGTSYSEYVNVWVDLNQDGTIDPSSEKVFQEKDNIQTLGTISGQSATFPVTAYNGKLHGRLIMQYAAEPPLCGSYTYGTTVDFIVNLSGATDNPNVPQAPTNLSITQTEREVVATFDAPANGTTPTAYVVAAQPGDITVSGTTSPITLTGLEDGKQYTFSVAAMAGTTFGADSVQIGPIQIGTDPGPSVDDLETLVADHELALLDQRLTFRRDMINDARDRFVASRSDAACHDKDETAPRRSADRSLECNAVSRKKSVPFDLTGSFYADSGAVRSNGSFFGQDAFFDGSTRRVSGQFMVTMQDDNSHSAMLAGQVAWEKMLTDDTVLGYFAAGDWVDGTFSGSLSGTSKSYSIFGGVYVVHAVAEDLYADAYGALGYGRTNMTVGTGAVATQGDYGGGIVTFGASLSGVYETSFGEIWPALSLDYGYSQTGRATFHNATGSGTPVVLPAGHVSLVDLRFTPEIKLWLEDQFGSNNHTSLSIRPQLICHHSKGSDSSGHCGAGAGVRFEHTRGDSGHLIVATTHEKIGDQNIHRFEFLYNHAF